MTWNPGTIQTLIDTAQYNIGRVGMEPTRAIIGAAVANQPSFDQGNPSFTSVFGAITWTTAQTLRSSPGRLYLLRVVNTSESVAVNVILYDSTTTFIIGGCTVPAQIPLSGNIAAVPGVTEVVWFGSPQGAGQNILTSLLVRAVSAVDGTTAAASGSLTVFALTSA